MEHEEHDASIGFAGGWYCAPCDVWIFDSEIDHSDELYP
jgi:hypothetical protein